MGAASAVGGPGWPDAPAQELEELVGHGQLALQTLAPAGGVLEDRPQTAGRLRVVAAVDLCALKGLEVAHRRAHLVEREAQRLHPPDDEDLLDVGLGVEPEAAIGAARGRDQADLVPVAQAAQGQLGPGRDLTDVHRRTGVRACIRAAVGVAPGVARSSVTSVLLTAGFQPLRDVRVRWPQAAAGDDAAAPCHPPSQPDGRAMLTERATPVRPPERSPCLSTALSSSSPHTPARPNPTVRDALRSPRLLRTEVLAGLVVALALIPEAISFSIIAGVDPRVGLFASFTMAVSIAFLGGRPAMISAATGAIALVIAPVVRDHGLDYLIATVILGGVIQVVLGLAGVARLMRFVPRSVMVGFVNALAILIFLAQVPHLVDVPCAGLPDGRGRHRRHRAACRGSPRSSRRRWSRSSC